MKHDPHETIKDLSQRAAGRTQRRLERIEAAIRQLAKDHPYAAVSWYTDNHGRYGDLSEWAAWVLAEERDA